MVEGVKGAEGEGNGKGLLYIRCMRRFMGSGVGIDSGVNGWCVCSDVFRGFAAFLCVSMCK